MARASIGARTQTLDKPSSIIAGEAAHFGALAADWWDPKGASAMLHRLNPARLGYIRAHINTHFGADPHGRTPLSGKRAIDVGCGAGLIAEPLARLGAQTSAIDAAPENIAVARAHAAAQGLAIAYHCGDVTQPDMAQALGQFDLVTCLEVIEHVASPRAFIAALAALLAPGGLMILSTPNRTAQSQMLLVGGAELLGMIPRGTHDWDAFLTPDELTGLVDDAGLIVRNIMGLSLSPARGFIVSDDRRLNYLMAATPA